MFEQVSLETFRFSIQFTQLYNFSKGHSYQKEILKQQQFPYGLHVSCKNRIHRDHNYLCEYRYRCCYYAAHIKHLTILFPLIFWCLLLSVTTFFNILCRPRCRTGDVSQKYELLGLSDSCFVLNGHCPKDKAN